MPSLSERILIAIAATIGCIIGGGFLTFCWFILFIFSADAPGSTGISAWIFILGLSLIGGFLFTLIVLSWMKVFAYEKSVSVHKKYIFLLGFIIAIPVSFFGTSFI